MECKEAASLFTKLDDISRGEILGRSLPPAPTGFYAAFSVFFLHTCLYIFSAHFVKISDAGHSGSGHQVMSSDLTLEKVLMLVIATPNVRSSWNFQRLISLTVSVKRISRNFYIGELRLGQCCELAITSQWGQNESHLFWTKTIRNILKHRITGRLDVLSLNIATSDPSSCRQGHFRS